jgi:hypothetical protein
MLTSGVLAVGLLVLGPSAHASQASAAMHDRYRDYLAPATSKAKSADTAHDQCSVPPESRVGAWLCTQAPPTATHEKAGGVVPLATTDYCGSNGCYYRYDDFHADFQSYIGFWGYGSKTLGSQTTYVNWQLTGAQTVSKPAQYQNSVATTTVVFSGDLLNSAPKANGSEISGAYSIFNAGNVPANTTKSWTPNGYKSYDNKNFDHSQVNEFSWNYPGYTGYWYSYVKSICTHSPDKTIYRFDSVSSLPANYGGGGYHA